MTQKQKVLIVEDDAALLRGIADNFSFRGYLVDTASDGNSGLEKAQSGAHDLIVLDVMLPKVNGYEICRYLRQNGVMTPTIFLTAKAEESDVLLGLGLGADDYMTKPFSIRELLARAEAVLRRGNAHGEGKVGGRASDSALAFADFVLDRAAHKLRRQGDGSEVLLSPKEYLLLKYLVERAGRALSREDIMDGVWGHDSAVTLRSIDRFVTTLRRKIGDDPVHPELIETIREFGYRFGAAVEEG